MPFNAEDLEQFKINVEKKLPGISKLNLDDSQWQAFYTFIENNKGRRKKLSAVFLGIGLEAICKKPYHQVMEEMRDKHSSRTCKKTTPETPSTPIRLGKRLRPIDPSENTLIASSDKPLSPTLKNLGVLERKLQFKSADDDASQEVTTPNGKPVRPYYSNTKVSFWTYITPEKKDALPDERRQLKARKKLFDSQYGQAPTQHFVATEDTLHKSGQRRPCSQSQLTGVSAIEVYAGAGLVGQTHTGNQYHWAHNMTFSLGGPHTQQNLIPTTRECNLGMYNLFEREVAQQVKNGLAIEMTGTPRYPDTQSLIPTTLVTELIWPTGYSEKVHSKPQSARKLSQATLASIQHARKSGLEEAGQSPVEESDNTAVALF